MRFSPLVRAWTKNSKNTMSLSPHVNWILPSRGSSGGVRYTRQELTLALTTPGPGEPSEQGFDESWVDPIVGVRWGIGWGQYDRWLFRVRSDIGGFGVGSDLALNFAANFGYRISRVVYLTLGGRYLYTDYSNGTIDTEDYFAFKGDQFGILAGRGFHF
ncbi:MAG: hypothetical protein V3T20_00565 [Gemmatimonadota bacterium]